MNVHFRGGRSETAYKKCKQTRARYRDKTVGGKNAGLLKKFYIKYQHKS